jgi:hypothetical protein
VVVAFWYNVVTFPWHPPLVDLQCDICGKHFKRGSFRAFAQGQKIHTCSRLCRDPINALYPPKLAPPFDRPSLGQVKKSPK